jgi:8-amino-7-oxononanoate synthase
LEIFHHLERDLAAFKGTEAALLFNSGYHANLGALSCLAGEGDVIFSDELNHASIIDGVRLSRAVRVIYRHGDLDDLRTKMAKEQTRRSANAKFLIATETVFSMDGDLCPLEGLAESAREFDAWLYLDEAHATGVFGARGAGLAEDLDFRQEKTSRLIQMGTLGKALGCFGAYVAAGRDVIEFLINRARPFIYTTALPPAVAAAARKALDLVQNEPARRVLLRERVRQFHEEFAGEKPPHTFSPILPIVLGDPERALAASRHLKEAGFWVQAIRPPTVPPGTSRLRVTFQATHTEDDVRSLAKTLQEILQR